MVEDCLSTCLASIVSHGFQWSHFRGWGSSAGVGHRFGYPYTELKTLIRTRIPTAYSIYIKSVWIFALSPSPDDRHEHSTQEYTSHHKSQASVTPRLRLKDEVSCQQLHKPSVDKYASADSVEHTGNDFLLNS
jgi:hypothetical protein